MWKPGEGQPIRTALKEGGGGIKFRGFLLTLSTTPDIPSACPCTQCNPV